MHPFLAILKRDLKLSLRQNNGVIWVMLFYLLTITLFPLAVGPDPEVLSRISSGVIWVSALLAVLLSLDKLFQSDFEDGSLDILFLSPISLELVILSKSLAHWLTTGFPLSILSPIMGILLNMNPAGYGILVLSMLLGTLVLTLIGSIGAALTLGVRRGGFLLSLLVLPFFVPTLIFGVIAVDSAIDETTTISNLMLLFALLLGSLALAPWASSAALRLNIE